MIENLQFARLASHAGVRRAAARRGLTVTTCEHKVLLYNDFYGFFFGDIINEDRLDAWIVDRRTARMTLTLTGLIRTYYDLDTCKHMFARVLAGIDRDSEEAQICGAKKVADLLYYTGMIAEKFEGIESGTLPIAEASLRPMIPRVWQKWCACMAAVF